MRHRSMLRATIEHIKRSLPLILLLRKPDLSFSFSVKQADCDSDRVRDGSESALIAAPEPTRNMGEKNGLLLYYNEFSFYSQKVLTIFFDVS